MGLKTSKNAYFLVAVVWNECFLGTWSQTIDKYSHFVSSKLHFDTFKISNIHMPSHSSHPSMHSHQHLFHDHVVISVLKSSPVCFFLPFLAATRLELVFISSRFCVDQTETVGKQLPSVALMVAASWQQPVWSETSW